MSLFWEEGQEESVYLQDLEADTAFDLYRAETWAEIGDGVGEITFGDSGEYFTLYEDGLGGFYFQDSEGNMYEFHPESDGTAEIITPDGETMELSWSDGDYSIDWSGDWAHETPWGYGDEAYIGDMGWDSTWDVGGWDNTDWDTGAWDYSGMSYDYTSFDSYDSYDYSSDW